MDDCRRHYPLGFNVAVGVGYAVSTPGARSCAQPALRLPCETARVGGAGMLIACDNRSMSFIQVKKVPEALHEAIRRRAAEENMTVSDYLLDLIQRDLALPSRRQWLARLATRESVDVRASAALNAARTERDDELSGT